MKPRVNILKGVARKSVFIGGAGVVWRSILAFLVFATCGTLLARTVTVNEMGTSSATVAVSADHAAGELYFVYGASDRGSSISDWDSVTDLGEVPAAGGVFGISLPSDYAAVAGNVNCRFVVVTAVASANGIGTPYHRDISVHTVNGQLSITVSQGLNACRLIMAYGAEDKGDCPENWDNVVLVAQIPAGQAQVEVAPPEGWDDTVHCVRFFAVDDICLQGTGTQYINLDLVNDNTHVVELDLACMPGVNGALGIYGCRMGASSSDIVVSSTDKNAPSGSTVMCLDFNDSSYSEYRQNLTVEYGAKVRTVCSAAVRAYEYAGGALTNDTVCADVFTCAGSAYLFAANDMSGGTPNILWNISPMKFYSLSVKTTGGTPVSSVLPCKVGGVGMVYDSVRNRYFGNVGSGAFAFHADGLCYGASRAVTPAQGTVIRLVRAK